MLISEAAHELFDAFDSHDLDILAAIFRDDLQLTVDDAAMDKSTMLALQNAYFSAFSNWDYNFSEAEQTDNVLITKYAVTGMHDGVLDLRPLGYDIHAEPTGKSITLPTSTGKVTFDDNGLVIALTLWQAEGADLAGLLAQLDLAPPSVG
jgi:hypothetical protein